MKKLVFHSILAGITIGIGVIINTSVSNKIVGALLFSLALLTILHNELNLYTGKIGFSKRKDIPDLFLIFLGNYLGVFTIISLWFVSNKSKIDIVCNNMNTKLTGSWYELLIKGIFCGILMYVAVYSYKNYKSVTSEIIVIMCIMIFILSGFEHCIADVPMIFVIDSWSDLLKYLSIIIGNSIGSIVINKLVTAHIHQTNGDKIRLMNDEELTNWISSHDNLTKEKGYLTKEDTLKWFQS